MATGLHGRQRLAVAYLLMGASIEKVARECRVREATVKRWMHAPMFRQKFEDEKKTAGCGEGHERLTERDLRQRVQCALVREAMPAAERVVALSTSAQSERVQLAANVDILDRAEIGPEKGRGASGPTIILPPEALVALVGALQDRLAQGPRLPAPAPDEGAA